MQNYLEPAGTPPNTSHGTAVLDEAHIGDIRGAMGTIRVNDMSPRRTWRKKLATLFAIMGPGLIVMVGDNDAGGVSTYTAAGQNYGTSLLWTLLLLVPVLIVNQEMVLRLGAVAGVGHARLIFERFGKFWGAFSVGDLFILNFLTIVTEFIGISQGFSYFGIDPLLSVPIFAILLVTIVLTGSFKRWETFMLIFVLGNLLFIPLLLLSRPHAGPVVKGYLIPGIQGGINSNAILLIIAIVGTTVAPWQLFFQQSNVVDKRITPRWINFERWDTVLGSVVTQIGAGCLLIAAAFIFQGTKYAGQFTGSDATMAAYKDSGNDLMATLYAILLIDAAFIGAGAVTLATAYAFGDSFRIKHSLHRKFTDAKGFYVVYTLLIVAAAGIVIIPNAPLGLMTTAVQALAGLLLPSATVFLLLLCNDKAVLGPWVNKPWLNVVAAIIVGVLIVLSLILASTTLFPDWDGVLVTEILFAILAVSLVVIGAFYQVQTRRKAATAEQVSATEAAWDKNTWRMARLETLKKPVMSPVRFIGLSVLRLYLVVAAVLLVIKIVQLAIGGGSGS